MRGDELRIEEAFAAWLESQGWIVERQVAFADVVAERDGERLIAEVKGRTAAMGLDVDTAYGQLLRRMVEDEHVRYALVVPTEAVRAVTRVPNSVRTRLRIDVYVVDENGEVTRG